MASPTSTSPAGRSNRSPSLERVTKSSGNWSRSRDDSYSDPQLVGDVLRSGRAPACRSTAVALGDDLPVSDRLLHSSHIAVDPAPQRNALVSILDSEYLQRGVVQLATIVECELLVEVPTRISSRHTLAGRDGPSGSLRRCLPNIGDEHHVHVDYFCLQVALNAGGPAELVLGKYSYSTIEHCPQQTDLALVVRPQIEQVVIRR